MAFTGASLPNSCSSCVAFDVTLLSRVCASAANACMVSVFAYTALSLLRWTCCSSRVFIIWYTSRASLYPTTKASPSKIGECWPWPLRYRALCKSRCGNCVAYACGWLSISDQYSFKLRCKISTAFWRLRSRLATETSASLTQSIRAWSIERFAKINSAAARS